MSEWFEEEDDVPFMMQVFQIREDKRRFIPAVTHVDGSGRLQTVCRRTNSQYYQLIEQFRDLTGFPWSSTPPSMRTNQWFPSAEGAGLLPPDENGHFGGRRCVDFESREHVRGRCLIGGRLSA